MFPDVGMAVSSSYTQQQRVYCVFCVDESGGVHVDVLCVAVECECLSLFSLGEGVACCRRCERVGVFGSFVKGSVERVVEDEFFVGVGYVVGDVESYASCPVVP